MDKVKWWSKKKIIIVLYMVCQINYIIYFKIMIIKFRIIKLKLNYVHYIKFIIDIKYISKLLSN